MHRSLSVKKYVELMRRVDAARLAGKPFMHVCCFSCEEHRKTQAPGDQGSHHIALEDWPQIKKQIGKCLIWEKEITAAQIAKNLGKPS